MKEVHRLVAWIVIHLICCGVFGIFAYTFGMENDTGATIFSLVAMMAAGTTSVKSLLELNNHVNESIK